MTVSGKMNWPLASTQRRWNGSAAKRRIINFYTNDGETNWSKVHQCFFYYNPDSPDTSGGHKLGFCDIVGARVMAIPRALFTIAGGRGVNAAKIPSNEKVAIKKKVNRYYGRMRRKFEDFDNDDPFPEVKNMPIELERSGTKEEFQDKVEEKVASLFNATSLAEMRQARQARKVIGAVSELLWDLSWVAENKIMDSETIPQMFAGVKTILSEAVTEVDLLEKEFPMDSKEEKDGFFDDLNIEKQLTGGKFEKNDFITFAKSIWEKIRPTAEEVVINFSGEEEEKEIEIDGFTQVKHYGDVAILKNDKGEPFFYARFTNNIWDKEEEVLTTEAHEDFVAWLDENPSQAPQLWDWHEQDTSKTHKAVWWDFADGFFHSIWPITEDEAKGIELFAEEFDPGMSHGFNQIERDPEDPRQITKYRSFEASILPREFAANEWTTFELIQAKEEGDEKMFSPEKQRALELLSLGKYKNPLGKASEEDAQQIDAQGAQRKDVTMDENQNDQTQPTPIEDTPTPAAPPTEQFEATVVAALDLLTQKMEQIGNQVMENTESLKGIQEKKGQSPTVAAWLAAQQAKSSVGHATQPGENGSSPSSTDEDGKDLDPLFGAGPTESPHDINGHLLANL